MTDETKKPGRGRKNGRRDVLAVTAEARVIASILDLRDAGMSRRAIGAELARLGVGKCAPYGYRVGTAGELVPDPAEQLAMAAVRELRAAGLSLADTVAELTSCAMLAFDESEPKK